jgi:hypothetical protein
VPNNYHLATSLALVLLLRQTTPTWRLRIPPAAPPILTCCPCRSLPPRHCSYWLRCDPLPRLLPRQGRESTSVACSTSLLTYLPHLVSPSCRITLRLITRPTSSTMDQSSNQDASAQNQRPGHRDMMFCHECADEWYRDEHGLSCPECGSDFTEIVSKAATTSLQLTRYEMKRICSDSR